jgi:ABC-type nitrate/sulfonate/bicarbonate transport system substrate-binding protein
MILKLWRAIGLAAAVTAVTAAVVVAPSSASNARSLDTINLAIPQPNANFASAFVAKAAGLFQKYGLDVNIMEGTGANTLNMIVSGAADLTFYTPTNEILVAQQGEPTTMILNGDRDSGAAIMSNSSITSLNQVKSLGRCDIATTAIGSQAYGYALQYTKIPSLGMGNCSISQAGSNGIAVARLSSGQSQLAVLPLPYVITVVNQIGAHLLVSPNVPSYRKQYNLPNFLSSGFWGLTSNVQSKHDDMVKFCKAIVAANKLFVPKNLTLLANYLEKFSSFNTVPVQTLRTSLQFIIAYQGRNANYAPPADVKAHPGRLSTNPAYIPKRTWDDSLDQWAKWGVANFDPKAQASQYGQRVNMSYLSEALRSRR